VEWLSGFQIQGEEIRVGTDQRGDDGGGAETVWALARSGGLASAVVIEEIGERGGELVRVGSLGRRGARAKEEAVWQRLSRRSSSVSSSTRAGPRFRWRQGYRRVIRRSTILAPDVGLLQRTCCICTCLTACNHGQYSKKRVLQCTRPVRASAIILPLDRLKWSSANEKTSANHGSHQPCRFNARRSS
jgi:hypothetical protein